MRVLVFLLLVFLLVVQERGSGWADSHNWSKFTGAFGVEMLIGTWWTKMSRAGQARHVDGLGHVDELVPDSLVDDVISDAPKLTPAQNEINQAYKTLKNARKQRAKFQDRIKELEQKIFGDSDLLPENSLDAMQENM